MNEDNKSKSGTSKIKKKFGLFSRSKSTSSGGPNDQSPDSPSTSSMLLSSSSASNIIQSSTGSLDTAISMQSKQNRNKSDMKLFYESKIATKTKTKQTQTNDNDYGLEGRYHQDDQSEIELNYQINNDLLYKRIASEQCDCLECQERKGTNLTTELLPLDTQIPLQIMTGDPYAMLCVIL